MEITAIRVKGDRGIEYAITITNGVVTCSCPDHTYRGGVCKHMLFAAGALNLTGV